jgi:AhpD family alkylhydroperoxidase
MILKIYTGLSNMSKVVYNDSPTKHELYTLIITSIYYMKSRMSIKHEEPRVYKAMMEAENQIDSFGIDARILNLIRTRASQLNGCGYCINDHTKDARKAGETEQRLYALSAWWETPFFTEEEQVILKLTEDVTHLTRNGISEDLYNRALTILGKQKLAQIIFAIITINGWNRIAITTHMVADED